VSLAEALAPMAAGAGPWRLVAPRGPLSALGPILAALGREGVRATVLRAHDGRPCPERIAAELEATDAAGLLVACLEGWADCPQVEAMLDAAQLADVSTALLEFAPPEGLTLTA